MNRPPSLHSLIGIYLSERIRSGEFARTTVPTVRCNLHAFATYVSDVPLYRLAAEHIEGWLMATGGARATMRHRFTHVRGLCRWLVRRRYLRADPTAEMRAPKQPRPVPRGVTPAAIGALLAAVPDARATFVVLLAAQEGLRVCEISRAELGDVDFSERTLLVKGKGRHERLLPISNQSWEALFVYLREHPAGAGPLIRSYTAPRCGISPNHLCKLVSAWMHDAGVTGTAHSLRHSMASHLLREQRADVRDVQMALGHVSLSSTSVYLPFSDVARLRKAMGGRWYGPQSDITSHSQLKQAN